MKMRSWSGDTFLADMYCGLSMVCLACIVTEVYTAVIKKKLDNVNVVADAAIGKTIPMFRLQ
jgi:hypothetical protein